MPSASSTPEGGDQGPSQSLRRRALLTTFATAIQGVARLTFSVLVGRFDGGSRELLGLANSSLSMSVLSSQLWAEPSAVAGTRFVAERLASFDSEGAAGTARHLIRRTLLVGSLMPAAVTVAGSWWLGFPLIHAVLTLALSWSYSMYAATRGVRLGAQQYRFVAEWDTIAAVTAVAATALILVLGITQVILLPLAIGYSLFALAARPRSQGRTLTIKERRRIDRFILLGIIGAITSGGLLQLSQLVAFALTGADGAGLYAAALTIATPASMLAVSLGAVMMPPLVQAATAGRDEDARWLGDQIVRQLTLVLVGIFGALVILSPLVIQVGFGPRFEAAGDLLPILLLAVMLTSIALGAVTILQSTRFRGPAAVAVINAGGLFTSVAIWLVLGADRGTSGVAIGYLGGAGLSALVMLGVVWRIDRQRWCGLAARLSAGVALMLTLLQLTQPLVGFMGVACRGAAVMGFAGVWALLNLKTVRQAVALLTGRVA